MKMNNHIPPHRFCWTRFGIESGESVDSILSRKENDRKKNDGMFLWGIGNSIGPAIRELVRLEPNPRVVFSPMRAQPKAIDVAPAQVFAWSRASTLDDQEWNIPPGLHVVSRGSTGGGRIKSAHYALVCHSREPLVVRKESVQLQFDSMVNLLSQNKLGYSQVTSVVELKSCENSGDTCYSVGFQAELVYPYFVKLSDPTPINEPRSDDVRRAFSFENKAPTLSLSF